MFNPVIDLDPDSAFWYVLVVALLIRTGTTLFEVPSTALLPDLEQDYDRRNKWLADTPRLRLVRWKRYSHHQFFLLG
jgi:hypothetical protein